MSLSSKPKHPSFFWQGTLILLPVLILAGAGLWALRFDQVTAEADALRQSQIMASLLFSQAKSALTLPAEFVTAASGSSNKLRSFLREKAKEMEGCFIFRYTGPRDLEYPPTLELVPTPQPWPLASTSEAPIQYEMQLAMASSQSIEKWWERLTGGEEFLQRPEAPQLLLNAYRGATNSRSQSGLPFKQIVALRFLSLLEKRPDLLDEEPLELMVSQAIEEPSLLSNSLLEKAKAISIPLSANARQRMEAWDRLWTKEEAARGWLGEIEEKTHTESYWIDDRALVIPISMGGFGKVQLLLTGQFVENKLAPLFERLKEDAFNPTITIAGKAYGRPAARPSAIALATQDEAVSLFPNSGPEAKISLQVSTALRDPQGYFARQVQRSWIFGGLIVGAAATALAGFAAAHRSFRRQLALSELKSNFVSSVSHELRAPIASVRLLAEGLQRGTVAEADRVREYYQFIVQECRRLGSLIENILDFSRIDRHQARYQFEPVHLPSLIASCLQVMEPYARDREVRLEVKSDPDPLPAGWNLEADGRALHQALVNLIDNAIKHSPSGATVFLEWKWEKLQELWWVSLAVRDSGAGVPVSEQQKIFDQFYRLGSELRRETPGIGIGLTIVKHVAEAHRGRVEVRSAPGQGSEFKLWIPLKSCENQSLA